MRAFCGGKGKEGDPTLGEAKWTESFQDLASWCPPHQDELNTPEFTMQDEFNFGNDGNVGERQVIDYTLDTVSPQVDMQCDQWGTSDPLFIQPFMPLEEENNNVEPLIEMPNTMSSSYSLGKRLINTSTNQTVLQQPSPIRLNGNLLLSQFTYEPSQETQDPKYSVLNTNRNVILGDNFEKLNSSSSSATLLSTLPVLKPAPLASTTPTVAIVKVKPAVSTPYLQKGSGSSYINPNMGQSFKVPPGVNVVQKKERPKLEPLNIESANGNKLGPSLDTPEVLKPLNDASQFDLLNYVCGTSEGTFTAEEVVSPLLDSSLIIKEEEPIRPDPEVIQSDHDYTEPHFMDHQPEIKDEPESPKPDPYVYDSLTSYSYQKRPKKRKSDSSDDYVYDSENLSDDSMDWVPSSSKKKAKTSKRRNPKSGSKGGAGVVAASIGRRTSFTRTTVDSDTESIKSTADRYRELRDRNNEASRRSRLNRKHKEMEMNDEAEALYKRNIRLTAKAKKLENLVGIMRKLVMAKVTALGKG